MDINLITIQKVQSLNKPLHRYLKSKGLNKQNMPFFIEKGNPDTIIMLSPYGRLFHFECDDGTYRSVPFQDPDLFNEALIQLAYAVATNRYPFFADMLTRIYSNLNYKPKTQPLF